MKLKKIVAREFLILISSLVLVGTSYLIMSAWNIRIERKNTSTKEDYKKYSDSLLISVKTLSKLAENYESKSNFYSTPKYLIVFYSKEITITEVKKDDLRKHSFENWVDAIKKNEDYKRGIFDNYIIHSYTDEISYNEWDQLVFRNSEIDSLKSLNEIVKINNYLDKKQKSLTEVAKNSDKLDIEYNIIIITILIGSLVYLLRFLLFSIRWSIKILKE